MKNCSWIYISKLYGEGGPFPPDQKQKAKLPNWTIKERAVIKARNTVILLVNFILNNSGW